MITLLMSLFVGLCFVLALFILIQQGKGDMGLGGLGGGGGQALFGGSGGQEFFERGTWIMVAIFVLGSLGLAIYKSRAYQTSRAAGYQPTPVTQTAAREPGR